MLEVVVVLTVLGLLAGIVGPRLFMRQGQATATAVNAQLEMLSKALDQYRFDTGHYPTPEQGLVALVLRPAGEMRWQGPYLARAVPTDPWGRAFVYRLTGPAGSPQPLLSSLGADGQEGGHNDAADIVLAPRP
ncbi:general secretion pathway protein G [Burkholderiales bacterium JOSHI_001]|nr:general secretion pathway protein G [Burkholderiales bacterium JOSHI_001]